MSVIFIWLCTAFVGVMFAKLCKTSVVVKFDLLIAALTLLYVVFGDGREILMFFKAFYCVTALIFVVASLIYTYFWMEEGNLDAVKKSILRDK